MDHEQRQQRFWLIVLSLIMFLVVAALKWFQVESPWLVYSLLLVGIGCLVRAFLAQHHFDDHNL